MEDPAGPARLKFYGPNDTANGWLVDQAVTLIRTRAKNTAIGSMNDALESHNALMFEEHGIIPRAFTPDERDALSSSARELRRQTAAFFSSIDAANLDVHLSDFEYEYAQDLLQLVDRFGVAKKVGGQVLFDALIRADMPVSVMLTDRAFVKAHDGRLREALLADARSGALLASGRLVKSTSGEYVFPASLSGTDWQEILNRYIDSESPHPNYVEAIAKAQDNESLGVTPKIRLAAQRRHTELMQELFADEKNLLVRNSFGVAIDPEQHEPVRDQIEQADGGVIHQRTFGERYLRSSTQPQRILANFASLVGYQDGRGLLALPSFRSQIGALEGLFVSGKDAYARGQAFVRNDSLTLLGTRTYYDFLRRENIEVEDAIAWYFRDYVAGTFGAGNFRFAPSTPSSTFLERCRHICAEMESVVKQYTLYCEDGELDRELLRMTSAARPWGKIPGLIERKYLRRTANPDCERALHLLFNDQSRITYIDKDLSATSFVELVLTNQVHYADFHHYQREPLDWLIAEGLVSVDDGMISFSSLAMLLVLRDINEYEAGPYAHYGPKESAAAETLVAREWLDFDSTLLTSAEASYFNFSLNKSEFSDGPDLRNRYAHGTNADPGDEAAHWTAYLQLIRLLVALVLKIQDDFLLRARA